MRVIPQPRSLMGLILLGFFLVALPLAVAVIGAVVHVDRLAQRSEILLQQGRQITRQGESLAAQLVDLERNARQYQVIGNPELLHLYRQRHWRFMDTLDQLESLPVGESISEKIRDIRLRSEAVAAALGAEPPQSEALAESLARIPAINALIGEINAEGEALIDARVRELQQATAGTRRELALQSALAIPAALVLALVFTLIIHRPMRQLRTAIRRMGAGDFDHPIEMHGPQELRALGRRLDWLRQQLLALEEEKNRFLRHMSHELKTPLASLYEGTELLLDGSTGELRSTQREVAQLLRASTLELQQMILNLLDFSAWQEKTARLNLSDVDLNALAQSIADQHRLSSAGRGVTVAVAGEPVRASVDRDKLRTALDNLVSNAVKYSPEGGRVRLSVRLADNTAVIDVRDQGPGVPPSDRERVFDPFFQGQAPHAGPVRGTGIGLSVVKECASAHGGDITILDSAEGAHFRLRLPSARRG